MEFKVNDAPVATFERPPWQAEIDVPAGGSMSYLSVTGTLDDGSRSEEVRFLNSPQYLEEVNVKLVELFTTVTDKSGRLVRGLTQEEFQGHRRQETSDHHQVRTGGRSTLDPGNCRGHFGLHGGFAR